MSDVTRVLSQIDAGDPQAAEQLLPLVYDELRKLAASRIAQEKPGQTLQATALVHEAYLRLVGGGEKGPRTEEPKNQKGTVDSGQRWDGRGHFFAAAAEAMRRILVESARRKQSQKVGGDWQRLQLSDLEATTREPSVDVLALSDALDKLAAKDSRKAALVKLRFFAGLTNKEAAVALGISTATADNDWAYAKSWLKLQLSREATEIPGVARPEFSKD